MSGDSGLFVQTWSIYAVLSTFQDARKSQLNAFYRKKLKAPGYAPFCTESCFFVCSCSAKLVIRWVDITQLEKNATLLFPDMIKVSTRSSEHFFSVFLNISETFKLMEQLANIAMRQLLDNEGFEQDRSLPKLKKKSPKKVSALKR